MARIHQRKDEAIRAYNDRFAQLLTGVHEDPANPYALVTYCNSLQPNMHLQYATLNTFMQPKTIRDAFSLGIQCEANLNIGDYRLSDVHPTVGALSTTSATSVPKLPVKCSNSGFRGHTTDTCRRWRQDTLRDNKGRSAIIEGKTKTNYVDSKSRADFLAQVMCHKCQQMGHYANKYPGLPVEVKKESATTVTVKSGNPLPTCSRMIDVPAEDPPTATSNPDDMFWRRWS